MPGWILVTQWIGHLILLILVGLSVWSVSIMIDRRRYFNSVRPIELSKKVQSWLETDSLEEFRARIAKNNTPRSPLFGTLRVALEAGTTSAESIDRATRGFLIEERLKMEKGLTVLATLGSNAPFIGLLGTVLGIVQAFGQLAQSNQGTSMVMQGISEALIATAVGLFVAIPAVIAYNYFSRQMREAISHCESARDRFVSRWVR